MDGSGTASKMRRSTTAEMCRSAATNMGRSTAASPWMSTASPTPTPEPASTTPTGWKRERQARHETGGQGSDESNVSMPIMHENLPFLVDVLRELRCWKRFW